MRLKLRKSRGVTVQSTNVVAPVASLSGALEVIREVATGSHCRKLLRKAGAGTYCETAALCRSVRISRLWHGWKFKNEVIGPSYEENLSRSGSFSSRSLL